MTTNEDLHELTAAYALDALDADERSDYEAHLAECDRCRADLHDLGETVGALALGAVGPAPPDALRERILVAAREEGSSNVVSIGSGRRRRWYAVGAAAAVAAVGLGRQRRRGAHRPWSSGRAGREGVRDLGDRGKDGAEAGGPLHRHW